MHTHDLDSLRLLARQRHEQRLREAGAERLAREIRITRRRRGLRCRIDFAGAGRLRRRRIGTLA
jgi:hypothetical protein